MSFNSVNYYLFLPFAVIIYFALSPKYRNFFLLAASYFFYMSWKAEYAALIFVSTVSTYLCAIFTEKEFLGKKRFWIAVSLLLNLFILFFFKYINLFLKLAADITGIFNGQTNANFSALDIILPVSISFYTFQALGYTIDVYKKKLPAERNFIRYALFVSFFPQLVAGPIERAGDLLPQFKQIHKLTLKNFHEGFLLILWGLFKKIMIADHLAGIVNAAYTGEYESAASAYIIAAVAFSFQIYCDFSAYSDIARGSAKILGFSLTKNFASPYTASSVREFWKRWHISLSTWFKDYLYIPLGGNRRGRLRNHFNVLAVFTVSGLWHGASLNFVFWGFLNGTYHVLENMLDTVKKRIGYKKNIFTIAIGHAITFLLVTYAFIFFRIQDIAEGLRITGVIFNANNFKTLSFACVTDMGVPVPYLWALTGSLILLIIFDIAGRFINGVKIISQTIFIKYAAYFALIMLIIIFGYYGSSYDPQDFIYFQF